MPGSQPPSRPPAPPPPAVPLSSSAPAELVTRAQAGDRAAFGELMRRYRPRVFALALHLTGDQQDADDVAQEAFLRAFRSLAEFRQAAEFFTWVYRIAVNLSLNLKRASARRRSVCAGNMDDPRVALAVQVDSSGDPRRAAELRQTYTRLIAALDQLSPALRSTVVLVALQGLSHEQAGAVLGCPAGTIAWRLHEARHRLARALTPPRRPADDESGLHVLVPLPTR